MRIIIGRLLCVSVITVALDAAQQIPVTMRTKSENKKGTTEEQRNLIALEITDIPATGYVGQKISYTLRLRYDPRRIRIEKVIPPTVVNAALEPLGQPQQEKIYENGHSYEIITWQGELYPELEGMMRLRQAQVEYLFIGTDPSSSNRALRYNPFNFFVTHTPQLCESTEKVITITQIPERSPQVFLIGSFTDACFTLDCPRDKPLVTGQACIGRVKLQGAGNALRLSHTDCFPDFMVPKGLKMYPSKKYADRDGYVFEYVMQAVQEGVWVIPAFFVRYFDPSLQKYRSLRTAEQSMAVEASSHNAGQPDDLENFSADSENLDEPTLLSESGEPSQHASPINAFGTVRDFLCENHIPHTLFWLVSLLCVVFFCLRMGYQLGAHVLRNCKKIMYRRLVFYQVRFLLRKNRASHQFLSLYELFQKLQRTVNWEQVREKNTALYALWHQCCQELLKVRFSGDQSAQLPSDFHSYGIQVINELEKGSWFF